MLPHARPHQLTHEKLSACELHYSSTGSAAADVSGKAAATAVYVATNKRTCKMCKVIYVAAESLRFQLPAHYQKKRHAG
jgi:hypothetical protein